MSKITAHAPEGEADINFEKFISEYLPRSIKRCRRQIADYESKLTAKRAELEKLVRHAAIAELPDAPPPEAKPEVSPSLTASEALNANE